MEIDGQSDEDTLVKKEIKEPKAKISIHVEYLGEEYDVNEDEMDVSCGFWDALGDVVAVLDYDIQEAREKRLKLKAELKGENIVKNDPYPWTNSPAPF